MWLDNGLSRQKNGARTGASGSEASAGCAVLSAGSSGGGTTAGNLLCARGARPAAHAQAAPRAVTYVPAALLVLRRSPRSLTLTSAQTSAAAFLLTLTQPQLFVTTVSTSMFATASSFLWANCNQYA